MPTGSTIQAMLGNGLFQYPNPETYNAAVQLKPEERPTVPVRVVNPSDFYDGDAVRRKTVNGFTTPQKDTVYIAEYSPMLKDPSKLAAVLAHEQRHILGDPESPAYALQAEVLKRLDRKGKYRGDIDQYNLLAQMLKGK